MIIGMIAIGAIYFARVGHGQAQSQGLQAAADSAALAGAQSIAHQAPQAVLTAIADGHPIPCGLGRSEANSLAQQNSASVTSYCYNPVTDRVRVTVRSSEVLESGRKETRTATAALGTALGPCTVPAPTPTPPAPSPSPSTGSPSPTTSPPDNPTPVVCGGLTLPIVFPGDGGDPRGGTGFEAVFHVLNPRLVPND